jgi:hypothetical protein
MSPRTFAAAAVAVLSLLAAASPASAKLMVFETQGYGNSDSTHDDLLTCPPGPSTGCGYMFGTLDGDYLRFIYDTADIITPNPAFPQKQSVTVRSAEWGWRGSGLEEGWYAKGVIPIPVTLGNPIGHGVTATIVAEYDPTGAYDHGHYDRQYELTVNVGTGKPFSFYDTYDEAAVGRNTLWITAAGNPFEVNGFYFFDSTHLDVHALAVPEPAAWALMLAGFGLAGASFRRRRTAASA